jgi:hypothetical protein
MVIGLRSDAHPGHLCRSFWIEPNEVVRAGCKRRRIRKETMFAFEFRNKPMCSRRTSLEYAGERIRYSNPRLDGHHFA